MSASLVGSEMCIRDSTPGHSRRRGRSTSACKTPKRCAAGGLVGKAACDPVSYTHLTLPTICSV
eukprot:4007042-Alexandrium_andersonii.AAC.1